MTTPNLAQNVRGKGRHYPDPEGDLYPSVTNVLGVIDKPALMWWLCKGALGAAWDDRSAFARMRDRDQAINAYKSAAYKQSNKAADLGTHIHEVCDALASDAPLPAVSDQAAPYVDQFLEWVSDFDVQIVLTERSVISREHRYGGTFDLVADLPDGRWMLDIKTGKGVYDEAALQLAALAGAEWMLSPDGSSLEAAPHVDRAGVLHLQADSYSLIPVTDIEASFDGFVGCRALWEFVKGGASDGVLGAPVQVVTS